MSSAGRARNIDIAEMCRVPIKEERVEEREESECHLVGTRLLARMPFLLPKLVIWLGKESILMYCKSVAGDDRFGKKWHYHLCFKSGFRCSFSLQKVSLYPDLMLNSADFLPGSVLISECSLLQTCEFQSLSLFEYICNFFFLIEVKCLYLYFFPLICWRYFFIHCVKHQSSSAHNIF